MTDVKCPSAGHMEPEGSKRLGGNEIHHRTGSQHRYAPSQEMPLFYPFATAVNSRLRTARCAGGCITVTRSGQAVDGWGNRLDAQRLSAVDLASKGSSDSININDT